MSSYFNPNATFGSLLKEGFKHYKGIHEAVMKNIEAIQDLSSMTRTSYGPNGMNKYIINMHDKLYLTKDASVMTEQLDINHPAANIFVRASKAQDDQCGDATNLVITFGGELLNLAGDMISGGLHLSDIILGYEEGFKKAMELFETIPKEDKSDIKDVQTVTKLIEPVIKTKLVHEQEKILAPLIAEACISALPEEKQKFDVDNVRVAQILGGSLLDSSLVKGLIEVRDVEGTVTKVEKCKVAVYNCPLETQGPETTDEVVFKNASDLLNYTKGEEDHMESIIKAIVDSGVKAVVVGGAISNMALHFLDKYGILAFRIMSKFELRRVAKALGATLLVRLGAPTEEEMGYADEISVMEISSTKCIYINNNNEKNKYATIILRGTTQGMLQNMERIVQDGVNLYKCMCKNTVFGPGAGAMEMYLANEIKNYAKTIKTLDQYGIEKFGEAFEVVPRTILENSGFNVNESLAALRSKSLKNPKSGVCIEDGEIKDAFEMEVYDHLETKKWAINFAVEAALTVLRIDQIIVAKPAGGPAAMSGKKPPPEIASQMKEQDEF
ncbi:MAG: T-complex protein 1 subunit theta [archaeon]|nr:T-complex protein 1 subunit theta [archaeon]